MKRFIKWFRQWVSIMDKEEKIGFSMGAVIGLLVCIFLFLSIDKVPATASDYELMEKQVIAIEQNPDLLYKTDCNITVNNEIITVSLMNDECKLIAKYNRNFELLSTQKEENDNYMVWWLALSLSILIGAVVYGFGSVILLCAILAFEEFWYWICKKIYIKEKSE